MNKQFEMSLNRIERGLYIIQKENSILVREKNPDSLHITHMNLNEQERFSNIALRPKLE